MNLPMPTDAEIAEFKALYDRRFGTDLTYEEAREASTILLRLFYLGTYGLYFIEGDKRGKGGPGIG